MDRNNSGINVDSDLSESWTLLDKESSEIDDSGRCEGNESSNEDAVPAEMESSKSISGVSVSSFGKLPLECPEMTQNEGTESLDSDGISIISESEEEEELKLLPCNSTEIDDRPCSKASNKYFDETDSASQHSMQDVPVYPNKKYKHRPNNNLNTSLNVLLIVAWAAVIGLGMGHFLGLQEECPNKAEEGMKIDAQTEELSVGLLKKLELENTALKEQFANLQKMMEEMNQKKPMPSCMDPPHKIPDDYATADVDESTCPEKFSKRPLEIRSDELSNYDHLAADIQVTRDEDSSHAYERVLQTVPIVNDYYSSDSSDNLEGTSSENAPSTKNLIMEKLEQSLDDVSSLFREKLDPSKISMENSREALVGTITVLSGLVENLKEKVLNIKDSLPTESLDFEKPFRAISNMEDILQKTSDKMQKITSDAFKEGKPLHSISKKVTSKLQAINKKLEEKWCQVKQHLSKQNAIWNWLDGQIFQNCDENNRIVGEEEKQKGKGASPEELSGGEYVRMGSEEKEKYKASKGNKKTPDVNNNVEYKSKQKIESDNSEKTKDKYRKKGWVNPYSFDNQPGKNGNVEGNKKKEKTGNKNERRDGKGDFRLGKNEGNKVNKSGEWMEAMFNHRAERRRDERRSDWYLSRSRAKIRESLPSRWYFRKGETKI